MPIQSDFLEYHKFIAEELNATKDRIRNLIGDSNWQTDGEHKEAVLRKVLRNYLPESARVGKGFVCFKNNYTNYNNNSTQIDILITAYDRPTLFKDGELVMVTPDAVQAIIEVKSKGTTLKKDLYKLSENIYSIRTKHNNRCLAGLFVYDNSEKPCDHTILKHLQSVANEDKKRVINWVAFGPNRFFRYWERGSDAASLCPGQVWHSYELLDGLAHSYFISNVIWDISQQSGNIDNNTQYAWFPVEGGKERFRRWYIPLSNGTVKHFNH
jgi:hypothetical protein